MTFDGRKLSQKILSRIKSETAGWPAKPGVAVVSVGSRLHPPLAQKYRVTQQGFGGQTGSSVYISQKERAAVFLGFGFKHFNFECSISSAKLREGLNKIAKSKKYSAMIVQLPLPEGINMNVLNVIPPEKDPDLLSDKSAGAFFNGHSPIDPPTPAAILEILKESGIGVKDKNITVFGYGRLVGRFLVPMFLKQGAVVSVIEKDLPKSRVLDFSLKADIIVSATGVPNSITADMIKPGAVVVDSGFSAIDGKIVGDVDFEAVKDKSSLITPVPGGVGPMGIAMLYQNIAQLFKVLLQERSDW